MPGLSVRLSYASGCCWPPRRHHPLRLRRLLLLLLGRRRQQPHWLLLLLLPAAPPAGEPLVPPAAALLAVPAAAMHRCRPAPALPLQRPAVRPAAAVPALAAPLPPALLLPPLPPLHRLSPIRRCRRPAWQAGAGSAQHYSRDRQRTALQQGQAAHSMDMGRHSARAAGASVQPSRKQPLVFAAICCHLLPCTARLLPWALISGSGLQATPQGTVDAPPLPKPTPPHPPPHPPPRPRPPLHRRRDRQAPTWPTAQSKGGKGHGCQEQLASQGNHRPHKQNNQTGKSKPLTRWLLSENQS